MDCIILAGGVNRRSLHPGYRPDYKALFELEGKASIVYVYEALRGCSDVERIAVVGPEDRLAPLLPEVSFHSPGNSLFESIQAALGCFQETSHVLIATADLPLLQTHHVGRFLKACQPHLAERDQLFLSVVPRDSFVGDFSDFGKNFNRFRDLTLSHGNLAVVTPSLLENRKAMDKIDAIYAHRTSPIGSALALGPWLGLSFVVGVHFFPLMRLDSFADQLSRAFHIEMKAIRCPFPEVALDLDEESDLILIRRRLEGVVA